MIDGGPRVVALGGGHGLAATLSAVRQYAGEVTAVVSVADDGGSSGRLRKAFGIPAPGDLRRCLVALGEPDSVWARTFEHRFPAGELEGHAVGNVVIAGLASATGDFGVALEEAGRMVGAVGRVLPATVGPVALKAVAAGGDVEGQVAVSNAGRIQAVSIVPPDAAAPEQAVAALAAADQVVIGPGSLFTSVLAVVVVEQLREALASTSAQKVYVCNLRPQVPETDGYDAAAHVRALAAHGVDVDHVLVDEQAMPCGQLDLPCWSLSLAQAGGLGHDPTRLAGALSDLLP